METQTKQKNRQNIKIGFNIILKPITKKGLIDNLNDYAIINLLK